MATNSLQSLHHRTSLPQRRHPTDCHPTTLYSNSLFLKPNNSTISLSSNSFPTTPFSLSSTTSTSPSTSQPTTTFDLLQTHLAAQNFRQADEETRRLLIALAGDAAVKRGYVFFSEVQFITESDLKTIDELWKQHSNNKFGYSVQKKIWNKVNRDFTKLFIKVGWMKKLDTEIEQYNYRAFPTEFIWELGDDSPEGHLPLTNALRGKQLLNCIISQANFPESQFRKKLKMDIRLMGLENPLFHTLHHILDAADDSSAVDNNKSAASHPTRSYVRDAKAMAATPADVKEYPNSYVFIIDMPGLKSGDTKVQIEDDNVLVISGERKREEEKEGAKFVRMERRIGKFMRKFVLPDNANTDAISAVCQDGVLTVTVEKLPPPKPKKPKTIEVKIA